MKLSAKISKIAIAAFAVGGMLWSSPSEAGGQNAFVFDCYHKSIEDESTTDIVTVEFFRNGKFVGSHTGWPDCKDKHTKKNHLAAIFNDNQGLGIGEGALYFIKPAADKDVKGIDEVRVIAHGDNALFIDQAVLARNISETIKIAWWGRDGGKGWCLSTDTKDGAGWKDQNAMSSCKPCLRFTKLKTQVTTCSHKRTEW
tara:strand:- start:1510 stop:2106 length:597 start_codon:yes stop_codon:yes gene_type:complete